MKKEEQEVDFIASSPEETQNFASNLPYPLGDDSRTKTVREYDSDLGRYVDKVLCWDTNDRCWG